MEVATTLAQAMQLHAHLIKTGGTDATNPAYTEFLTSTALSGHLSYARSIFNALYQPTPYLANTLIRAHANRSPQHALLLFVSLQQSSPSSSFAPDRFTYPSLLAACARLGDLRQGRQVHGLVVKDVCLGSDLFVQNSLVHMYSACGEFGCAMEVFERMSVRDVVTWTSMIDGAQESGRPLDALQMFGLMEEDGISPNDATAVSVLGACSELGWLSMGRKVHRFAEKYHLDSKTNVTTALIDMYVKCGCIERAWRLFENMPDRDVCTWTVMISGYVSHGKCEDAVDLFQKMKYEEKIQPDERTITAMLRACRDAGWISKGYLYFDYLEKNAEGGPKLQHYGCMVDMLARAGRLDEAEQFIQGMPIKPDAVIWRAMASASKLHGDFRRAQRLMKECFMESDYDDSGSYVFVGNVYASLGKWEKKARLRKMMEQKGIKKPPGFSRIEVNGILHEFKVGDYSHPEAKRIHSKWEEVTKRLKGEGYKPKLAEVLLDMEDQDRSLQLEHHSEKLAVAYGLISMRPEERILVVKNLRSCEDCHEAMKLVSKIYKREIIIRDRIRFHYFRDGTCSCKDSW